MTNRAFHKNTITHCPTCNEEVVSNRMGACSWCSTQLDLSIKAYSVERAALCAQLAVEKAHAA